MRNQEACSCFPTATKEEIEKMDRWFAGEEVEGFPKHDRRILYGFDRFQEPEGYMPPVSKEALLGMRHG